MSLVMPIDYWMLEVLDKAMKVYALKRCFTTTGKRLWEENTNPFNPLGQINIIRERIRETREQFDADIKAALKQR